MIAAERIMPFRRAVGALERPEIARTLAMVQDDLLIKLCQIVKHANLNSKDQRDEKDRNHKLLRHRHALVLLEPIPDHAIQFIAQRGESDAVDDFAGESVN